MTTACTLLLIGIAVSALGLCLDALIGWDGKKPYGVVLKDNLLDHPYGDILLFALPLILAIVGYFINIPCCCETGPFAAGSHYPSILHSGLLDPLPPTGDPRQNLALTMGGV